MAKDDYTAADRDVTNITAGDKIAEVAQVTPDADAADFAADEGVSKPEYANYAEALGAYAARSDIEGLAERRAREVADTFAAADFMRAEAYNADGTAADAPRPGTVHGDAPVAVAPDGEAGGGDDPEAGTGDDPEAGGGGG